ncbi:MAG: GNAT family N-acetyltransferase [Oceanospirillales bacterium]|nr:GNAT family N-acetyltransferase [Oceanospirillales bacterium]
MNTDYTTVQIVTAQPDDLRELATLFDLYRVFYGYASDLEKASTFIRERLDGGDGLVLLAKVNGQAVGFVQCYAGFSSLECKPSWLLSDLYVLESTRGKGVGSALLAAVKERALKAGCCVVELFTAEGNLPAQHLYEAQGYRRDVEYRHYELFL